VNLITTADALDFAHTAAQLVHERVARDPSLTLTLPTGSTPLGLYELLTHEHERGCFSLDEATVFMLDEYVDLPSYPEGSFIEFLRETLGPLVFNARTVVKALTPSSDRRCLESYDRALDEAGGLDLAIIGVGRNGHVGFNEPGADVAARTNVVTLAEDTLAANFAGQPATKRPTTAVTIGLADLRQARSVLMLVAGEGKSGIAATLRRGERVDAMPATHLLDHEDLTIVMAGDLDR